MNAGMDLSQWEWTCACCGERKRGIPDYGFDAPIHHYWASEGDPDFTVLEKTDDDCVMEIAGDRVHFIRCVLLLPVHGADQAIGFGVWSTLGEQNYHRYADSFFDGQQSKLGPMFGYLGNRIAGYPDTLNLQLEVAPQDGGARPLVRVLDSHSDHPLYRDQNDGLDGDRLTGLLSSILPCSGRA